VLWVSAQGRRLQLTPQIGRFPGRAGTRPTDPWASVEFATSVRLPSFKHAGPNRRGVAHESCRLRPRLWREDISPRGPLRGRSLQAPAARVAELVAPISHGVLRETWSLEDVRDVEACCGDVICDPFRKVTPLNSARLGADRAPMAPDLAMRMRGLEPPRGFPHTDLNRARLPIPPHPPGRPSVAVPFPA
jgi:hypothetical protein